MSKRARRVPMVDHHPTPSSYASVGDDHSRPPAFKIRSLQHDYEDLFKETEAMKRGLHETKHRKRVLLAQVKFLREKYRFLTENPRNINPTFRPLQRPEECQKMRPSKSSTKVSSHLETTPPVTMYTTHPQHPAEMQMTVQQQPSMRVDKANNSNKQSSSTSGSGGCSSSGRKRLLVLDLNQTTAPFVEESNEFHSSWSTDPSASGWEGSLNLQLHCPPPPESDPAGGGADLKLAVCRNAGKDTAPRAGKRKITWQDQVALRV